MFIYQIKCKSGISPDALGETPLKLKKVHKMYLINNLAPEMPFGIQQG